MRFSLCKNSYSAGVPVNSALVMRLTMAFLLLASLHVYAGEDYTRKITLSDRNIPPVIIQGTVTDSAVNPLPGVTILVKNTKIQGITDGEEKFKLTVPSPNSTLLFTSVGN